MAEYRIYHVDGTGKITAGEWFEARSDDEAIVLARSKRHSVGTEVWNGNRMVAQIAARKQ